MTATPSFDIDQAWQAHQSYAKGVEETAKKADSGMRHLLSTLKAYRCQKKRCSTPNKVDYGLVCEMILEMELLVND